ncbi:MAG TPA: oligosaccharide flippase family protein [Candidatus Polarisedimenticolia bacterium]|nr:oligosaccharide flippase family protein [Candidatus Polarisedimenticolia bacterium]
MSLAKAILGNVGATLVSYVPTLATGILTARLLGPEGKGVYVLAFLVSYLVVNVFTLGVGSANIYYIARGERDARTALGTTLAIVLPLGALGAVAIWSSLALGLWVTPHATYIAVAAWSIVPMMGEAVARHTLLGLQRYTLVNWLIVVEQAVLLALLALGSLLWGGDLFRLCVLHVLASFASFAVTLILFMRSAGNPFAFNLTYARQALHYGLRGHVGWLAQMLNYRLDMLFVDRLAGARALGLYSAAVSLAETLWILPSCVSLVAMPRLASTRRADASEVTATLCRLLVPLVLVAAIALALLGGTLIGLLYGSEFLPSIRPLLLLLPGVALLSIVKVLSADLAARGRPGLVSAVSWISLGVTIALDIALIGPYGASGAAVASSVAYAVSTVVTLFLFWRLTSLKPTTVLVPRAPDVQVARAALDRLLRRPAAEAP